MAGDKLTKLQRVLLDVLRSADQPMTRREIAARIGRQRTLNPYDLGTLKALVSAGLVKEEERSRGVAQSEYIYTASVK